MKVACKIAVLRWIPVVGRQVMAIPFIGCATRRRPILVLRVVEAELDALLPALLRKFTNGVAVKRRCRNDVKRIRLRIEHGKAVMMLGGDDDVFHACRFRERDDIVRTERGRVELRRKLLVVCDRDGARVHDPLTDTGDLCALPGSGGY